MRILIAALPAAFLAAGAAADDAARFDLGRTVFLERAQPACGVCHTLADAGVSGEIGPILDTLKPSYDRVHKAITEGVGPMVPYEDLSAEELDALAWYVSEAASR